MMSSDSDDTASSPRGWTIVNDHGRAQDSEDSSGSSEFVDLGEDVVRYRHVSRTSSAIGIPSTRQMSSSISSTSLPANFRAHGTSPAFVDQSDGFAASCSEEEKPCSYGNSLSKVMDEPVLEQNQDPNKMSIFEDSASSSSPTLVESPSALSSFSSGLGNSERTLEEVQSKGSTNSQASPREEREDNVNFLDHVAGVASDSISVDSIEVLSMPFDESTFRSQGEAEMVRYREIEDERCARGDKKDLVAVITQGAEDIHPPIKPSGISSSCEESDTSEFERIDPEMIPLQEAGNQTEEEEEDEDRKMDVAGARPVEELVKDEALEVPTFGNNDRLQNVTDAGCYDHMNVESLFPHPLNLAPPDSPDVQSPSTSRSTFPWQGPAAASRMIQPFPLDLLPEDGAVGPLTSLHLQLSHRQGLLRQHSNSSSEEGFELLRRPRVHQEDDVASTVSSSSDLSSGFVNVCRRRGPPVGQRQSDYDDMVDSISNFTDGSEDCLPANMMVRSQASGVKQYRHHRDEGFNTRLDWLVAMVLFAGLALGIGHFIGSTQEMVHQRSINTGQVQRLRELQDDLVTCLDRTSGIDSRIATEKTSPALQAVRLMEGLNFRMQEETLNAGSLLEQKVGSENGDVTERSDIEGEPSTDKLVSNLDVQSRENKNFRDGIVDSQLGEGSSGEFESGNLEPAPAGSSEEDGVSKLKSGSAVMSNVGRQEQSRVHVLDVSVISDGSETIKTSGKLGEIAEEAQEAISDEDHDVGRPDHGSIIEKDSGSDQEDSDTQTFYSLTRNDQESRDDFSSSGSTTSHPKDSTVQMLQRKLELMEEKINQVMKTAQYWEAMLEEERSAKIPEDQEQIRDSKSSDSTKDEASNEEEPLAGIASTLKSLWLDVLKTDKGNEFLQYLNRTWGLFSHSEDNWNKSLWSDLFYRKFGALKTIPESDQVQAVVNNTKLLTIHLQKELELLTGYMKNQSLNLVEESNITIEGLSEQVSDAWAKLKNVSGDVVDFNKDVLYSIGDQLTETLHSVENVSANFINKQNISMSKLGYMAHQVWGTVKNYSSVVRDTVLNSTAESAEQSKEEFYDLDKESDTSTEDEFKKKLDMEPNMDDSSGFGKKLKGAWDSVRNYSSNFTLKQNLSISGLREQVKAAWGKVKNTSSQVLQDVSKLNLAEKVKDGAADLGKKVKSGAKELGQKVRDGASEFGKKVKEGAKSVGEKVGTTFKSVKKQAERFCKTKGPCGRKKHWDHSKRHQEFQRRTEEIQNTKRQKHANRKRRWKKAKHFHPKQEKKRSSKHHSHHEIHQHQSNKRHKSLKVKQDLGKHYSVPSMQDHQWHLPSDISNERISSETQQQRGEIHHYSAPPRWPLHRESNTLQSEPTVPQSWQKKQGADFSSDKHEAKSVDNRKEDRKHIQGVKLEGKGCPSEMDLKEVKENHAESNWEDLFDCVDMHCRGDDECMHNQRRDAARLYSELLDYEQWLKERSLRKDVRELREFLEELGEFLSETDSDDRDLDELKDEFGEMVQDMEDGAKKRYRKQNKLSKSQSRESHKSHHADSAQKQKEETENSTVILDLKFLPQHGDSKPDQEQFSSSQTHHSSGSTEKRKFAGWGFQSTNDNSDWYLQRAKDRANQRESHHWAESEKLRVETFTTNWYMHWVQGRINGRTGVTVWDMYEWIRERYLFREELRRLEVQDSVNWFLRKP